MYRGLLGLFLFALATGAIASSTLRVGSQVLVAGDSSARAIALLGKPSHVSHRRGGQRRRRGSARTATSAGERWQYRRGGHTTTLVIVDDRITEIEDRRD